jgi:hypothetical protein
MLSSMANLFVVLSTALDGVWRASSSVGNPNKILMQPPSKTTPEPPTITLATCTPNSLGRPGNESFSFASSRAFFLASLFAFFIALPSVSGSSFAPEFPFKVAGNVTVLP